MKRFVFTVRIEDVAATARATFGEAAYGAIIGGTPPPHDWRFTLTFSSGVEATMPPGCHC